MSESGLLIVLVGPSGAGKTTLVRHLEAVFVDLRFSVSFTTRARRPGEEDGRDYHFTDLPDFEARVAQGEFLEHALVHGNRYGTHRPQVEGLLRDRKIVLLDIDVQGALQVRAQDVDAVYVFVLPPSFSELERRLRSRATDGEEVIQRRLTTARREVEQAPWFDYVVVNDDVALAGAELEGIVRAERVRRGRFFRLARFRRG